jgi:hypothetical protein
MQQNQKTKKGENKNLPEQTIPFSAATGAQAPTRPSAVKVIRLNTVNLKQIDVTRARAGASVLLNPYTA